MRTPLRFALGTAVLVLVAALALVLYVLFGDLSVHKDRVLAAASDASGFYIASEGPFDLDIGEETSLLVENVIVGNPAYPDEHPLASVGSLRVVVDTWSLLRGPIEINLVAIGNTIVNLKQRNDGAANWMPAVEETPEIEGDEAALPPVLHKLTLDGVNVNYEVNGKTELVIQGLVLRADRNAQDDYAIGIAVELGAPTLDKTLVGQGSAQFGAAMDAADSVHISFDDAVFEDTSAGKLKARFSGSVTAQFAAEKPVVDTDIDIAQLYFVAYEAAETEPADDETVGLLFPATPLSYSWLGDLDLQAGLTISEAVINGDAIRDVEIAATIESGALHVDPVSMVVGGGTVSGSLHLAPADAGYALDLSASASELKLAQLAAEDQSRDTVPPLDLELQLQGSGLSLHDIMASSNGKITGRQGTGQLDLQGAGALFADMLTSVVRTLNPLAEERTYADIECGILDIDIAEGVASIEELALQSDRLTIISSGKIDFSDESIDLTLSTKSREGLGLSVGGVANSFVKIGGTLSEPSLGLDAAGTVTTTGAAVATGGLSVIAKGLWNRLSSEIDLCAMPEG